MDRWVIDLAAGKVRESRIDDRGQEFPRIDERLVGKRHRYGYTPTVLEGIEGGDCLLKHDLIGGSTQSRCLGPQKHWASSCFTLHRRPPRKTRAC